MRTLTVSFWPWPSSSFAARELGFPCEGKRQGVFHGLANGLFRCVADSTSNALVNAYAYFHPVYLWPAGILEMSGWWHTGVETLPDRLTGKPSGLPNGSIFSGLP